MGLDLFNLGLKYKLFCKHGKCIYVTKLLLGERKKKEKKVTEAEFYIPYVS